MGSSPIPGSSLSRSERPMSGLPARRHSAHGVPLMPTRAGDRPGSLPGTPSRARPPPAGDRGRGYEGPTTPSGRRVGRAVHRRLDHQCQLSIRRARVRSVRSPPPEGLRAGLQQRPHIRDVTWDRSTTPRSCGAGCCPCRPGWCTAVGAGTCAWPGGCPTSRSSGLCTATSPPWVPEDSSLRAVATGLLATWDGARPSPLPESVFRPAGGPCLLPRGPPAADDRRPVLPSRSLCPPTGRRHLTHRSRSDASGQVLTCRFPIHTEGEVDATSPPGCRWTAAVVPDPYGATCTCAGSADNILSPNNGPRLLSG